MTDKEAKELLAKSSLVWKAAERSIREMKIKLAKYSGDKIEQTQHLNNLDGLLNLSHKQAIDIGTYEDLLAQYLFKIGELSARLRDLQREVYVDKLIKEL
tara:strand:+ start:80 stop:379 length:300 start_codon:yes stop_codon:yes gene_type:complete